jgi:hypothetical protein
MPICVPGKMNLTNMSTCVAICHLVNIILVVGKVTGDNEAWHCSLLYIAGLSATAACEHGPATYSVQCNTASWLAGRMVLARAKVRTQCSTYSYSAVQCAHYRHELCTSTLCTFKYKHHALCCAFFFLQLLLYNNLIARAMKLNGHS